MGVQRKVHEHKSSKEEQYAGELRNVVKTSVADENAAQSVTSGEKIAS